jgi:hypothetical protein
VNTALSLLLQDAYAADARGQEESGALAEAELALSEKRAQADLYARTVKGLPVYGAGAPSAGQMAEFEARLEELELEQADLQTKLDLLREAAGGECAPSETTTCGRTPQAAPDPWTAADGTRCAGHATKEAFPGAFCGRWASPVRVHSQLPPRRPPTLPRVRRTTCTRRPPRRRTSCSPTSRPAA